MRTIPLSRGKATAVVDDKDYLSVSSYRWSLTGGDKSGQYAGRTQNGTTVYMHRVILSAPKGVEVDHINADRLDNRRCNLRIVTPSQNQQAKRGVRSDSTTGYRGVEPRGDANYRAVVWLSGKRLLLGHFTTAEEAARAAAEGRRQYMTHAPECAA